MRALSVLGRAREARVRGPSRERTPDATRHVSPLGRDPRVARLLTGGVEFKESIMYNIWLVGAVVIVLFVLGYVGFR